MRPQIDRTEFGSITIEGQVELLPTPEAIETWNEAEGDVIGLFHITC